MKYLSILFVALFLFAFTGCVTLNPVKTTKNGEIMRYKYFIIPQTGSVTSNSGLTISGNFYPYSKSVNASDNITAILSRNGLIRLFEMKPDLSKQTLIVNYFESGRRSTGLGGYTIEVTIQFLNAETNAIVSSCTAEGQGSTEADDIRIAIDRCMTTLLLLK